MKRVFIAVVLILFLPSFILADAKDKLAQAKEWNDKGVAYGKKGQYDKAIEDYNKAIALNPNYSEAYFNRGNVYYKKGNMGRSISDFQKACDMGDDLGCKNLKVLNNR